MCAEIRERLYVVSAKRAIFRPDHADVFIDVQEQWTEAWHTEEERVLNEAAKEARSAVERTIRRKSAIQEEARKTRANKRVLQVATASLTVCICIAAQAAAVCVWGGVPLRHLSCLRRLWQLVRTAIAIVITSIIMEFACDGTLLWNVLLPGLRAVNPDDLPGAIALYAPALVGAFEFSTAWIEFFRYRVATRIHARAAVCASPLIPRELSVGTA